MFCKTKAMAVRKQIFIAIICEYFVRTLDYRRLMGDPAFDGQAYLQADIKFSLQNGWSP